MFEGGGICDDVSRCDVTFCSQDRMLLASTLEARVVGRDAHGPRPS